MPKGPRHTKNSMRSESTICSEFATLRRRQFYFTLSKCSRPWIQSAKSTLSCLQRFATPWGGTPWSTAWKTSLLDLKILHPVPVQEPPPPKHGLTYPISVSTPEGTRTRTSKNWCSSANLEIQYRSHVVGYRHQFVDAVLADAMCETSTPSLRLIALMLLNAVVSVMFDCSRSCAVVLGLADFFVSRAHTKGVVQQRTLLRRVLRRVLEIAFEKVLRRILRRCLAVGLRGKKGFWAGFLEGVLRRGFWEGT